MSYPPQFEAPSTEELHELLPAYDVVDFIAKGGMGAVYRAHQKSLERDVAIKILPREFGADQDFRKLFEDEAKAMARLNHPNLIGVYDFGEVDGMPYIVMEFVDGKSLHHSAHGKAIDQKEAARLVHGICEGLAHAHDAGILHRDIKPANILLDSKARPKIGDFGLARAADSAEGEGMHFGTPDYGAPEAMKNPDSVDKRGDVYSCGVILYELLTGKLPEKAYQPASQVENVDPRFDKIVRRATHPSPTLRYADAGAMAKDIKALREALDNPLATIVTSAPAAQRVEMISGNQADAGDGQPAVPLAPVSVGVSTGNPWGLLRNVVIIVILLGAIYGMMRAYQWRTADLARQERERDEKEQLEKQAALAEALERQRERERERIKKPPMVVDPVNLPKPKKETPLEVLARLKTSLAGGDRSLFPPETHQRSTLRLFLVETPMSWQRAAAFAESYGGHLATLKDDGESNWVSSKIPRNTTVWIGGGAISRSAWGWVDGSPWVLRKPSTSTGNAATMSDLGTIRAKPSGEELPFFIQWQMDGENPGSQAAQLERLKESLRTPDPIYPPGVISYESRRYLIIEKEMSWDEAASTAGLAEGHLAVPSQPTEGSFLLEAVSKALPDGAAAWIGGQHNGRAWVWSTGEPWTFAAWAPDRPDGSPANDSAVRLVAGPEGGWDDADPTDEGGASAFIIEWSNDRTTSREVATPAGGGDWAGLRQQALQAVKKKRAQHTQDIFENGKSMKWDLDFWHRGLRDNEEQTYAASVAKAKSWVNAEGRIVLPQNQRITLPPRGVKVIRGYADKEARIEVEHLEELNKLRLYYLGKLKEKLAVANTAGLTSQIRAIKNEIEACGTTGASLLEHFKAEL